VTGKEKRERVARGGGGVEQEHLSTTTMKTALFN